MKTKTFVPALCKGDDAKFEGSVELRLPTFDEKFEHLEALEIKMNDDGEVDLGNPLDKLRLIRKIVSSTKHLYVSVSIKNKETAEEFKSFDDLSADSDCHPILIEVGTFFMNSFKMGNA